MQFTFKPRTVAVAIAGVLALGLSHVALADSTDDLLKKLKEKGVLTEAEYDEFNSTRDSEKVKKASEIKASFKDGIAWESGDKQHSLALTGRVHTDYRYFSGFNDDTGFAPAAPAAPGGTAHVASQNTITDTFDIRRARIGLKGRFYNSYEFEVVANVQPTASIDIAYMNINWWEEAQFRIGQFKMPFNLEELTSSNNIDFMERSYVNAHAPAKELGAMIHGVPTKGITYALAVSNGAGANNLDTDIKVNDKDIIGRVTVNAAELMGNSDMILHAGIAGSKGDIAAGAIGVAPRTLARGVTSLTLPVLSAATATVDPTIDRTRLGLEGAVAYGPVKVQGEWVRSSYEFNRTATLSHDVDFKSWYAEALWLITGEKYADFYKNGVFGGLKPKNDFVHPSAAASSGAWGLWELGLRFSKYDASDLNDAANAALVQNAAAAGLGTQARGYLEAKSYTVGIKFLPNANTRFMLNYVKTDFEEKLANTGALLVNNTAEDEEKAIIMRAQWMF